MTESVSLYETRDVCRACGNDHINFPIKFDELPLAGTYVEAHERGSEPSLPMHVGICERCGFVQLREVVLPEVYTGYRFVGTASSGYRGYLDALAEELVERHGLKGKRVVELGSSNGYLLGLLRDRGQNEVFGYEPSHELRVSSQEAGLQVTGSFFGPDTTGELPFGGVDAVVVRHVLEHIDDIDGFIGAISDVVPAGGLLVIEVPDLDSILERKNYFHFYHEHLSYFTAASLSSLVQRHGFNVTGQKVVEIHGGSLLVFCEREGSDPGAAQQSDVAAAINHFTTFADGLSVYLDSLAKFIGEAGASGARVAGYGAAQRTTNACGMAGLGQEHIEYLVDKNEHIQGYYTPGAHLLIDVPDRLRKAAPDIIVLFASSFEQEIMQELGAWAEDGGQFISLHPTPRFIQ